MVVHRCPVRTRVGGTIHIMRMSAKAEYAVRAMVQLAAADEGSLVKTDDLAKAQGIPPQFLVDILSDLRTDRLVRSHRGREGGYELARPAAEISIADVLRCIDGPLASVRDIGLGDLPYSGPTASLTDVWRALRASMRSVLEETSLADVATGRSRRMSPRSPATTAARRRTAVTGARRSATSNRARRLAARCDDRRRCDAVQQHSKAAVEIVFNGCLDGDLRQRLDVWGDRPPRNGRRCGQRPMGQPDLPVPSR